ncbi:MAG TPA: YceI family protein [Candidatus Bathyarchaeia archaeon]|nr:YceI family protein [Candidatus Bathyarchaeia archaeon]
MLACLVAWLLIIALPGTLPAEMQRWEIVPGKSRVSFETSNTWSTIVGTSESPMGQVELDVADLKQPAKGTVTVTVNTLRSWRGSWNKDIWKALDAPHHPEISYRIERVESSFPSLTENVDVTLSIHGVLTIRGVERSASFMSRLRQRQGTLWARGETYLRASDFDVPPIRSFLFYDTKDRIVASFDLILNRGQAQAPAQAPTK